MCLWHRSPQTDESISMRFLLFESWVDREISYEGGLMNTSVRIVLGERRKSSNCTCRLPIDDVSTMSSHSVSSWFRIQLNTNVSSDFYLKKEKISVRNVIQFFFGREHYQRTQ